MRWDETVAQWSARALFHLHTCPRRQYPERPVFLQPACALVAQQRAADLAGIVAQTDARDLETFRVLVAAEPVGQKRGHAAGNCLCVGARAAVEDGVLAATQFHPEKSGDAGAMLLSNWVRAL